MKKYALLWFVLIFPFFLVAQDWKVDFGKPYKRFYTKGLIFQENSSNFLGINNQYYYLNYMTRKKNELLQFDFNHNLVNANSIVKNSEGKKLKAEHILKTKSGNYLISSYYYKRKNRTFVYAIRLNDNGSMEEAKDPIFSHATFNQNMSLILSSTGITNNDSYGYSTSPDSTKILFTRVKGNRETRDAYGLDKYQVFVFDHQLNKLWEKETSLPNVDRKVKVEQIAVSNKGEVLILAKNKIRKTKNWIPKNDFITLRINKEGKNRMNTLRLKNSYPISAVIFSNNDDLFVAGFYTEGIKKASGTDGTFMMKFDKDDELLFYKKYPFEEKIRKYLIPTRQKRMEENYLNIEIDDLLIDYKNGLFLFVGENRYYSPAHKMRISEDILVSHFTFDGDLKWNFHKSKKIYGSTGAYGLTYERDNIFLIYNVSKTSKERKQIQHKKRPNWTSIYTDVIKLNGNGEIEFEDTIFHSRDLGIPIVPGLSRRINNDNMLLFFIDDKRFQYGTLKFRK